MERQSRDTEVIAAVVVGDDRPVPGAPAGFEPRKRRLAALVVVAGILVVVGALAINVEGEPPVETSGDLQAPAEPIQVQQAPIVPAVTDPVPELARRWAQLGLPGHAASVDGGDSGWIVALSGDVGLSVVTSADGVTWRLKTIDARGWHTVVHSDSRGLWLATASEASSEMWRSVDGGGNWELEPLPDESGWVLWIGEAGGETYAAGMIGSRPWTPGEPALWRHRQGWERVSVKGGRTALYERPNADGWVASVVEWQGEVYALGSSLGPTVWSLESENRVLVGNIGSGGFVSAVVHDDKLWGTLALEPFGEGQLMKGASPQRWGVSQPLAQGSRLEVMDGVLTILRGNQLLAVGESVVPIYERYEGLPTGREGSHSVSAMAGWGADSVIVGYVNGDVALWVRKDGSASEPVLAQNEMTWAPVTQLPGHVMGTVRWHDRVLFSTEHGVWEATSDGLEWIGQIQSGGGWNDFLPTEDSLFISTPIGLWRLDGVGLVKVDVPLDAPTQVAMVGDSMRIGTVDNRLWELGADGWEDLGFSSQPIVGSVPGAFVVASSEGFGLTDDGREIVVAPELSWGQSGVPFFVIDRTPDSTLIRLIEAWPDGRELRVPTRTPNQVLVIGREIRVRSATELLVSTDDGASWLGFPAALESHLPLGAVMLPTDEVAVAGQIEDGSAWVFHPTSGPRQWHR